MSYIERQRQLLRTGEYSDFTISVEGREFKVHRSVICPQSPVLHRLCTSNFKEGLEGSGSLVEESTDAFERVLEFLYTGDYDSKPSEVEAGPDDEVDVSDNQISPDAIQQSQELMIHANVYLLAKYLDVDELMRASTSKFSKLVSEKFRAGTFLEPFARVFNHGSDGGHGLRSEIVSLCVQNSKHIPKNGELDRLLREHEPIAWHLLLSQFQNLKDRCKDLKANVADAHKTIGVLRQRESDLISDRDCVVGLLKDTERCRNCSTEFGAYIEHRLLRCRSCLCRHVR